MSKKQNGEMNSEETLALVSSIQKTVSTLWNCTITYLIKENNAVVGSTQLTTSSGLKKVDNKLREAPHKFNHLPKRRPITIEFNSLSYFVPEGSIFKDKGITRGNIIYTYLS